MSIELWISVAFLLAAACLFLRDVRASFPLDYDDEPIYLGNGLSGLLQLDWSPFYSLWYRVLHLVVPDTVGLFFTSMILIVSMLSAAFFLLLLNFGLRPFLAALGGLWVLLALYNGAEPVKVIHFHLILFLGLFCFVSRLRLPLEKKFLLLSVILLILSYSRPESVLTSFLCFLLFCGLYSVRLYRPDRFLWLAWGAGAVGVLAIWMFPPFSRGWEAFMQHYNITMVTVDPARASIQGHLLFPRAHNALEALLVNPGAVLEVFFLRLRIFIGKSLPAIALGHYTFLNLNDRVDFGVMGWEYGLAAFALLLLALFLKRWKETRRIVTQHAFLFLMAGLFFVKAVILCVTVNPTMLNILDFGLFGMAALAVWVASGWQRPFSRSALFLVTAFFVFLLFLLPKSGGFPYVPWLQTSQKSQPALLLQTVQGIREFNRSKGITSPLMFAPRVYSAFASEPAVKALLDKETDKGVSQVSHHYFTYHRDWAWPNPHPPLKKLLDQYRISILVIDKYVWEELRSGFYGRFPEEMKNFRDPCWTLELKNAFASVYYRKESCPLKALGAS
ncbi:MAG TPA: hypothetical protein VIH99_02705 [Bdellovibrionota bacterium]